MSEMNALLGEVFNTTKVASSQQEQASDLEFFGALCKEAGIKVDELTDAQVTELFDAALEQRKLASAPPPFPPKKDEEKGEKKKDDEKGEDKEAAAKLAAAEAEYAEKRAAAVKVAEAEACGRIMAHAMDAELQKIAADMGGGSPFPPKKDDEGKEKEEGKKDDESKEKESSAEKAAALIRSFAQAKTANAAGASNLDEIAAFRAIDLLKEAGVDGEQALRRIDAVFTLGMPESTKIASAADFATACHTRALEFCEAAGYPVDWNA